MSESIFWAPPFWGIGVGNIGLDFLLEFILVDLDHQLVSLACILHLLLELGPLSISWFCLRLLLRRLASGIPQEPEHAQVEIRCFQVVLLLVDAVIAIEWPLVEYYFRQRRLELFQEVVAQTAEWRPLVLVGAAALDLLCLLRETGWAVLTMNHISSEPVSYTHLTLPTKA